MAPVPVSDVAQAVFPVGQRRCQAHQNILLPAPLAPASGRLSCRTLHRPVRRHGRTKSSQFPHCSHRMGKTSLEVGEQHGVEGPLGSYGSSTFLTLAEEAQDQSQSELGMRSSGICALHKSASSRSALSSVASSNTAPEDLHRRMNLFTRRASIKLAPRRSPYPGLTSLRNRGFLSASSNRAADRPLTVRCRTSPYRPLRSQRVSGLRAKSPQTSRPICAGGPTTDKFQSNWRSVLQVAYDSLPGACFLLRSGNSCV